MATVESADRPASLPVEEYKDIADDNAANGHRGDDNDDSSEDGDDEPLLRVPAETVNRPRPKLVLPEVPTFLYFVSLVTLSPVQQFWLYDYFSKEYQWEGGNDTDSDYCSNSSLTTNSSSTELENMVQAATNRYVMYISFISSFTAVFPVLFLGPLTDKFGRKFVMYISFSMLFFSELLALMVFRFNLKPNAMLVSSFIQGISGNYGLYLAGTFGMVADISVTGKQRTLRVATVEAAIATGVSMGVSFSGIWVEALGFVWPMIFCLGLISIAILFLFFFIPETYTSRHHHPFSCKDLVKGFEFYVKDTTDGRRFKLIICLVTFMVYVGSTFGESNFSLLYLLHQPFCWREIHITVFNGVLTLLKWVIVMLFVHLGKRWISEPTYTMIGTGSGAASYLLKALATSNVLIFTSAGVGLCSEFVSPMCRSIMSKSVSQKEQGALFAGIGVLQMIVAALSGVLTSYVYRVGLRVFLGLPYIVLAALATCTSLLMLALIIQTKRRPGRYEPVLEDERIINQ